MTVEARRSRRINIIVATTMLVMLVSGPTAASARQVTGTDTATDASTGQWLFGLGLALAAGLIAFALAMSQRRPAELETDDR